MLINFKFFIVLLLSFISGGLSDYLPKWSDLDKRPLPEWYDRAKVGIFLHWGVFSVPSYGSEWFWTNWASNSSSYVNFMNKNYPPNFSYQDFAPQFTAEFFNPTEWADLFKKAGARYVVLTSKHHEGFTLFPSKRSFSWNSVDVGPHRDLVGELSQAVTDQEIKFGVYHSLFEWFNPIYLEDKDNLYSTRRYPKTKLWPDIIQLILKYKPSVLWSDGDWEALDTYWNSTGLLAWLYNDSPVKDEIVVNDRWGIGTYCKHGDFYNCHDRYNPGTLQTHKWENAFTLDKKSWGYRRNMDLKDVFKIEELIKEVVVTVSCGGNALINVGPTKEGTIPTIFEERLLQLGNWLTINGDAIYSSSPWLRQNDTINENVWYTCQKISYDGRNPIARPNKASISNIYAIVLKWPTHNILIVQDLASLLHSGIYKIRMLGSDEGYLDWKITDGKASILFPNKDEVKSDFAWTLMISE